MNEQRVNITPEPGAGSWKGGMLGPDMGGLIREVDRLPLDDLARVLGDHALPQVAEEVHHKVVSRLQSLEKDKPVVFSAEQCPSLEQCGQIARMFLETYGERYPNQRLMQAETIREDIAAGKYVILALSTGAGRIKAIGGLSPFNEVPEFFGHSEKIFEIGKLIVSRQDQGQGLCTRLLPSLIEYAVNQGASSLVSFAFTSHDFSQRALSKVGFQTVGINVGEWPVIFDSAERESAVVMHLALDSGVMAERRAYVPAYLEDAANLAFGSSGCSRTFDVDSRGAPALESVKSERADLATQSVQFMLKGEQDISNIIAASNSYLAAGFHHVLVSVQLQDSAAVEIIDRLSADGFRFASIIPLKLADVLTLQKMSAQGESVVLAHSASKAMLTEIMR